MKCVILAGGKGTRMEGTETCPKPLIKVGGIPIIEHICRHYASHGLFDFIVCAGYKGDMVQDWARRLVRWNVEVVDTGLDTLTGGRLKQVEHMLNSTFCMTYGDSLCDVDIKDLLMFHREHTAAATVTAVQFADRFGHLDLVGDKVVGFREKDIGWINGGYFVLEMSAFKTIQGDQPWEQGPLQLLAKAGQLRAYRHDGHWQCMDHPREKLLLEEMLKNGVFK